MNDPTSQPRRALRDVVGFLTLLYTTVTIIALALPGTLENPGPAPVLTLLAPAAVVGILWLARRRRHQVAIPFGLRRLGTRGWPAAILLPVVGVGGPFMLAHVLGIIELHDMTVYVANVPFQLALLTVLVLGEEIGWRGYMLPRLTTVMSAPRASLLTGFAHGLFHLPLILLTVSYDAHGNRAAVSLGVVAVITLAGTMYGWLRIRHASLWPAAIAHAAVNTCIIEAPHLTSDNLDRAASFAGEAGIFTLLCTAAIALWIYRRARWTPEAHEGSTADEPPTHVVVMQSRT